MFRVFCLLLIATPLALTLNMMPGGITDNEKPVTTDLKSKLGSVQAEVEAEVEDANNGLQVWSLDPVSYKSQIVAGVNYFVKYRLNKSDVYYDARIFEDLSGVFTLQKINGPKTESDPIAYFE